MRIFVLVIVQVKDFQIYLYLPVSLIDRTAFFDRLFFVFFTCKIVLTKSTNFVAYRLSHCSQLGSTGTIDACSAFLFSLQTPNGTCARPYIVTLAESTNYLYQELCRMSSAIVGTIQEQNGSGNAKFSLRIHVSAYFAIKSKNYAQQSKKYEMIYIGQRQDFQQRLPY